MASAEQDQWQEIAAAIRAQLAKAVLYMPAMNPGEVASFVGAVENAQHLEAQSAAYDLAVEEYMTRLVREMAFGG